MPALTVISPVLNGAQYLPQMLQSVELQDVDLTHIIVDGGSTDDSIELCNAYCRRNRWAELFTGRDSGQADAINRGISRTDSEVVTWLNADDYYQPRALETALRTFSDGVVAVYGDCEIVNQSGALLYHAQSHGADRMSLVHECNPIPQPATFFSRRAFLQVGGLDANLHYCMDYELWIKLAGLGELRYVPHLFAAFRLHEKSKTCSRQWRFHLEHAKVARRYGAKWSSSGQLRSLQYLLKEPLRWGLRYAGWTDPLASYLPKSA